MKLLSILILVASCATAGEYALLSSGMRMRVDRHEERSGTVTLYSGEGSMTLRSHEVAGFEAEEYVAPKPPNPAPQANASAPAPPRPVDPKALVDAAAKKTAIPAKLLRSVVAAESAYRPDAVSSK